MISRLAPNHQRLLFIVTLPLVTGTVFGAMVGASEGVGVGLALAAWTALVVAPMAYFLVGGVGPRPLPRRPSRSARR